MADHTRMVCNRVQKNQYQVLLHHKIQNIHQNNGKVKDCHKKRLHFKTPDLDFVHTGILNVINRTLTSFGINFRPCMLPISQQNNFVDIWRLNIIDLCIRTY